MVEEADKHARQEALPSFLMVSGWVLKHLSPTKYAMFQNDVQTIQESMALYYGQNDNALNLKGMVYSHLVAKILIRHIAKRNPGIFDKMMANPGSVTDPETQSNIIAGHIKGHPSDASKVIEKFKQGDIDPRVYNRAARYSLRLKSFESHK